MNKIPLIVILGSTASGKTAMAVEVAKHINGEVISADSMQIYKKMDIGTAKPTLEEMQGIPHHLIDIIEPETQWSVADYCKIAHKVIEDVAKRGKIPILAGGTGLYINAVVNDMKFEEGNLNTSSVRDELSNNSKEELFEILKQQDPQEAQTIDKDNKVRLIRAVEVCKTSGMTMTEYKKRNLSSSSKYEILKIGLNFKDRQLLYDRINKRVDLMVELGLLEEAKEILSHYTKTAGQAIGYKELLPYFSNEVDLDTALDKIKQSSRNYAKRQLTWFRRDMNIQWYFYENFTSLENMQKNIQKAIENFLNVCYN